MWTKQDLADMVTRVCGRRTLIVCVYICEVRDVRMLMVMITSRNTKVFYVYIKRAVLSLKWFIIFSAEIVEFFL